MSALACPCGSGSPYRHCCRPLLRAQWPAPTAEALMRSRYTAYVRRDEAYLLRTWKASRRPASLELDDTIWLGLEVLATDAGGVDDARGTVDFIAHYEGSSGAVQDVREHSRFTRIGGAWFYVDGETPR